MKLKRMYIICVALLLISVCNIGFAQLSNYNEPVVDFHYYPTKGFRSIRGQFLFRLGNELIYINKNNTNKKRSSYSIKAINMRTKKRTLIDWCPTDQCVKCGRNAMLYIKNGNIMRWNANSKRVTVYRKIKRKESLKGIGFNTDNSSLLLILKEKKSKAWICKLIDKRKRIVMNDTINMDTMSQENIQPKIGYVSNHFAISVKNNLFTLNCNKLELKLLSRECWKFLLNSDFILYYQWRDSTKLDSYYSIFEPEKIVHINSVLNDDIVKCSDSFFFQTQCDKYLFPKCFSCNNFNMLDGDYWYGTNNLIYKDDHCVVKYKMENDSVNINCFQWKYLK